MPDPAAIAPSLPATAPLHYYPAKVKIVKEQRGILFATHVQIYYPQDE
jgi:hypothetical protein